ncbi:hypothetical protein BH20ACI3_BH20ACI3_40170 [soil metagenome]
MLAVSDSYQNSLTASVYFHLRWRIGLHDLLCEKPKRTYPNSQVRLPYLQVSGLEPSFFGATLAP